MGDRKETIVIRSPNWIGDAVVATAILKPLRLHHPDAAIHIVAKQYVAPVFYHHPYQDGIITFSGLHNGIRSVTGDTGIILPNSFSSALLFYLSGVKRRIGYRSECRNFLLTDAVPLPELKGEHLVENYRRLALKYLGSTIDDQFEPLLFLSHKEKTESPFDELLVPGEGQLAIVDPGSAYGAAKEWQVEKYAAVVDYLAEERGFLVVLLGSAGAKRIADAIYEMARQKPFQLTGKLTLRQAIRAISRGCFYFSPDTGGMHIAAAFGIPQVAIFGSSSPLWTGPLNKNSRVVYRNLECSPCFQRTCPLNTYACLAEISPEDVIGHIEEIL
jgi:heptosyltransferase-2